MQTKIIVLGKNYSTSLGVIRPLGQAGYKIDLLYIVNKAGDSKIAAASKYVDRTIEQLGRRDEEIIDKLTETYTDEATRYILLPSDDYTSSLIDRYRDKLAGRFVMPYIKEKVATTESTADNDEVTAPGITSGNDTATITGYMDKGFQVGKAKEYGLKAADSWEVSLAPEQPKIPDDLPYPCFCKPIVSARGGKREICKCKDRAALTETLTKLRKKNKDRSVILQEFLEIEEEFSISGVCLDEQIILPALLKKVKVAEFDKGVTMIGRVDKIDELKETIDKLTALLKSLHYVGMIDIELIKTRDGIYFNELNFRSSGVSYAVTKAGCNLPKLLADYLCKETAENESTIHKTKGASSAADTTTETVTAPNAPGAQMREGSDYPAQITYGLQFIYNKAAWEDYIHDVITKEELDRYFAESDFTMLDDDNDPAPLAAFNKFAKGMYLRTKINKVFHFRELRKKLRNR